ncbi:MAG: hypothetical protein KJ566_03345 [Nanoarchaeota archaeon]|nr:hypothetical protein [Nanoarchaeota archaeon]
MKIELKAIGNNASGKTRILKKVKSFLEKIGFGVKFSPKDEHKLLIFGEFKTK